MDNMLGGRRVGDSMSLSIPKGRTEKALHELEIAKVQLWLKKSRPSWWSKKRQGGTAAA